MRLADFSASTITAGFVTVLVGFTSSAVIVFQAAATLGADAAQIGSWIWALGLGMGITCIGLSLRWRIPVVTAWSTPGAALLISAGAGASLPEAIGAFVMSAALLTLAGFSGLFERLMNRLPVAIASGMLAGVLLRFGIEAFAAMGTRFGLVAGMLAVYLVARRWLPRFAVMGAFAAGILIAASQGLIRTEALELGWARPVWTTPTFSVGAFIGLAVPLFLVTMASQNMPGVAVIRASGFATPLSPVLGWIGVVNLVLAPFGGFALNLAAITAALCMGPEAHPDPARRYTAAVSAGIFYLLMGLAGATVVAVFAAFPRELVAGIAGIALLGTIGNALAQALTHERDREPALVTFLVTASGLSLGGIGSAFWGLVAGGVTLAVLRAHYNRTP
ncbi:MAG: benzoate/H(+) symporter BenE family transporter [Burkholderiales bacterium]|nr:benzoate/H(+) symporter BenE family transporter [Burkholderiales bacterium]